ncbi:MAG TPA: hypothetical protein VK539_07710 [Myxococcaceae bacterium]|nr:hypothetical protein [Myxococcaceae bacterium]
MTMREEQTAYADFLGELGQALAARLALSHDKHVRYFAAVNLIASSAAQGGIKTLPFGEFGPIEHALRTSPVDAIRPSDDGTISVGIAVLPPDQPHDATNLFGMEFVLSRGAEDGGYCVVAGITWFEYGEVDSAFRTRAVAQRPFVEGFRKGDRARQHVA